MTLRTNSETLEAKQLTLSEMVLLAQDCTKLCWEKTERIVENMSRAPRGWERTFKSVAEERRHEDNTQCMSTCSLVQRACPDADKIKMYEQASPAERKKKFASQSQGFPSIQEISRCEHATENFAQLLFALAHKPSKVSFETGGAASPQDSTPTAASDGAPTEVHRKVLQGSGNNIDSEIMKRWSTARRERLQMEDQGVIRSADEAEMLKQQMKREENGEGVRGTTPKW